jgi:hypothetical protein
MSRIEISTRDLFLRLGATPGARSERADRLFRRLRGAEGQAIIDAITRPAQRVEAPAQADEKERAAD